MEKKGAVRTGVAPFLLVTCKMATCNARVNRGYVRAKRIKYV